LLLLLLLPHRQLGLLALFLRLPLLLLLVLGPWCLLLIAWLLLLLALLLLLHAWLLLLQRQQVWLLLLLLWLLLWLLWWLLIALLRAAAAFSIQEWYDLRTSFSVMGGPMGATACARLSEGLSAAALASTELRCSCSTQGT
jgi:hypothetical protein